MKLVFVFLISFSIFTVSAQNNFQIKVIDSVSYEPLSYASIGILNSGKNTVSNLSGYFVIDAKDLPCTIQVFYIGYKRFYLNLSLGNVPFIIKLIPSQINLNEVVIKPEDAEIIFEKAYKNLKNYQSKAVRAQSFFRLTTLQQNEYTELIESYFQSYLNNTGIKSWEFNQGRYALVKDIAHKNFVASLVFSMINRYLNIANSYNNLIALPDFPFQKRFKKIYSFEISERYATENGEIIGISFKPKIESFGAFYSGIIFINTKNFNIVKIDVNSSIKNKEMNSKNAINQSSFYSKDLVLMNLGNQSKGHGLIETNNKNVSISDINLHVKIQFKEINGLSFPNAISFSLNYTYENFLKKIKHPVQTQSTLINYYIDTVYINQEKIPFDETITDYSEIASSLYMPQFWKDNDVLAATPVEEKLRKDFEKSASFGKAFNNANDTIMLLDDGYVIWDSLHPVKKNQIFSDKPNDLHLESSVLTVYDEINETLDSVASFYTDLYFVWNCFNDTLHFIILPLFDLKGSFISNSYRDESRLNFIIKVYFNLCKVYSCKLKNDLSLINDPCKHKETIKKLYEQTNKAFYNEKLILLNEVWTKDALSVWENKVNFRLTDCEKH